MFLVQTLEDVQAALRDLGFNRITPPLHKDPQEALLAAEQELTDIALKRRNHRKDTGI